MKPLSKSHPGRTQSHQSCLLSKDQQCWSQWRYVLCLHTHVVLLAGGGSPQTLQSTRLTHSSSGWLPSQNIVRELQKWSSWIDIQDCLSAFIPEVVFVWCLSSSLRSRTLFHRVSFTGSGLSDRLRASKYESPYLGEKEELFLFNKGLKTIK